MLSFCLSIGNTEFVGIRILNLHKEYKIQFKNEVDNDIKNILIFENGIFQWGLTVRILVIN